jgi:hypothetical protein
MSVTPASTGDLPDLCTEELDQFGDPARCDPVGPGMAPWWDDEVCCDDHSCWQPGSTGCPSETKSYWCESAVLHSAGTLACVYEVPSYCELFPCGPSEITVGPLEHAICCYGGDCYDHEGGPCGGYVVWCGKGVTNADGTVTCLDEE